MDFKHRNNINDSLNKQMIVLGNLLDAEQRDKLLRIKRGWNFYDGYHWEDIPAGDKPEVTENYCSTYVNKYVSFEIGNGFTFKADEALKDIIVDQFNSFTMFQFLEEVWKTNSKDTVCIELGQMKSITGDAWIRTEYKKPSPTYDPFGEYPKGKMKITVMPTSVCFPEYDEHDKNLMTKMVVMYPITKTRKIPIIGTLSTENIVYKQIWTRSKIEEYEGNQLLRTYNNNYNIIPFTQIKNYPVAGRTEGVGDLEDIIPLNVELNMKKSDISEIIDYHSAPITVVYGAKINNLEKGANKLWGGLPKDAKIENLQLKGDLVASVSYVKGLKETMSEIGGVPAGAMGGEQAISNTSGIALQYVNMPLIERTRIKRMTTREGLELVNKHIIHIALAEGLISKPESISNRDFYHTEVTIPDTLPKDKLIELQLIEQEMKLGLEDRKGAMKRLNKEDIEAKLAEIDKDREEHPDVYDIETDVNDDGEEIAPVNKTGNMNGRTRQEVVRKETTGENNKNTQ